MNLIVVYWSRCPYYVAIKMSKPQTLNKVKMDHWSVILETRAKGCF